MVNRIENNIKQSSNYVEKAKENTAAAVTYQKKARKVRSTVCTKPTNFGKCFILFFMLSTLV